jgi:hypothetical protein
MKIYKSEQEVLDRFELPIVRGAINRSIKYMLLEEDPDPRFERAVSLQEIKYPLICKMGMKRRRKKKGEGERKSYVPFTMHMKRLTMKSTILMETKLSNQYRHII